MVSDLEITNLLTLTETATARINVPNTNGKYLTIDKLPGMDPLNDDPILWIKNGSLLTDNDVFVNGSITSTTDFAAGKQTGGGALLLSHGWKGSPPQENPIAATPPLLQLTTTGTPIKSGSILPTTGMNNQTGQIFYHTPTGGPNILYIWTGSSWVPSESNSSGYYDTLFLFKSDCYSPANLDLGNLTAHDSISSFGNLTFSSTTSQPKIIVAGYDTLNFTQSNGTTPANLNFNSLVFGNATYQARIILTGSENQNDTLRIQRADGSTPANLSLTSLVFGNVAADPTMILNGAGSGHSILYIKQQNGSAAHLNAGTVYADTVQANEYRSKIGGNATFYGDVTGTTMTTYDMNATNVGATNIYADTVTAYTMMAHSIYPSSAYATIGWSSSAWISVWADTICYHHEYTGWDTVDDLDVVRNMREIVNEKGEKIIDPETIKHLKNKEGFYESYKVDGWHLCVQKKLLEKIDALEQKLEALTRKGVD